GQHGRQSRVDARPHHPRSDRRRDGGVDTAAAGPVRLAHVPANPAPAQRRHPGLRPACRPGHGHPRGPAGLSPALARLPAVGLDRAAKLVTIPPSNSSQRGTRSAECGTFLSSALRAPSSEFERGGRPLMAHRTGATGTINATGWHAGARATLALVLVLAFTGC